MKFHFKHKIISCGLTILILVFHGSLAFSSSKDDIAILKQQYISFLQSGASIEDIPKSNPLYAIREYPIAALTFYYITENDPSLLREFYSRITRLALARYEGLQTNGHGLLKILPPGSVSDGIALSPYMNALGNIDIYALFMISSKIGMHADALEFLLWYDELSKNISDTFYSGDKDCILPIDSKGNHADRHYPQQLLPLILDRRMDPPTKRRIFRNCVRSWYSLKSISNSDLFRHSGFHRCLILELLSNSEALGDPEHLGLLMSTFKDGTADIDENGTDHLTEVLRDRIDSKKHLIDNSVQVPALTHFSLLIEKENLLIKKLEDSLSSDVDTLNYYLSSDEIGTASYLNAIRTVNRLLMSISALESLFESGEKLWKTLNESRWRDLSPRVRYIITRSCPNIIDELMNAKVLLSSKLEEDEGLSLKVNLPLHPVETGKMIQFKAYLKSSGQPYDISRAILQVGGNRFEPDSPGTVRIDSGGSAVTFTNSFMPPRSSELGIMALPVMIDFISDDKRIEIHRKRSLVLRDNFEALLNFPSGRKISKELPVNIVLKIEPEHTVQGTVEGVLCDPLECSPELPARFQIKAGESITELPLKFSIGNEMSPGRFPFSLKVNLGGRGIAEFRENIVKPINWLYLGPLSDRPWIINNGVEFHDDLVKGYPGSDGHIIKWSRVPSGAIGQEGEVLLGRLGGGKEPGCALLYTVLEFPADRSSNIEIESMNTTSLWINGTNIISDENPGNSRVSVDFRKGKNSVIIASAWNSAADPVLLEIFDDSGLPVHNVENRLNEIITEYANLDIEGDGRKVEEEISSSPREISFSYRNDACSSVSVVGSFNNWDPESTPMLRDKDGGWSAIVVLYPGRYPYKLLIDRKMSIVDPGSDITEPDGFGGTNSVLIVK